MNVLHLDTGREFRGGQRQLVLLLRGLAQRGHVSFVLAPRGASFDRIAAEGVPHAEWTSRGDLDLGSAARADRARGSFRPDLVHAHSSRAAWAAGLLARRLSVPAVASRRVATKVSGGVFGRWKHRFGIARYLCVSQAAAAPLRHAGVAPSRIAVVPSGVDLSALARVRERAVREAADPLRAELRVRLDAEVVGTVAALTVEKRPHLWLATAAEVVTRRRETHFVWIGDGPERGRLEQAIGDRGLSSRVHLLGAREDPHELQARFTLFLLTSAREGLGTAVLDAQALGVPVITTRAGGVEEIVHDGVNGAVCADADLTARTIAALERPELRAGWSDAAHRSVLAHSADAMVAGTVAQYAAVLAATRSRA